MEVFGKGYASAYDYIYQDKDYEKECDFVEAVFSEFSGKPKSVLDLGCGTGGHALILARRGYRVVGVDRSKNMLDIAKKKAKEAEISIEFLEGDIASLDLQKEFDAVISMFSVMSYQTTNIAISSACETAKKHLSTDGIFLFDCWYGPAVLTEKPSIRVKEVRLNNKEKLIRFTEPVLNIQNHTVETQFKVWKIEDGRLISEITESHLMRFLFPREIKYFLELAGFLEIELCPFPRLGDPLTEHDWNMAVIARKLKAA